jgi:hypothetical protein
LTWQIHGANQLAVAALLCHANPLCKVVAEKTSHILRAFSAANQGKPGQTQAKATNTLALRHGKAQSSATPLVEWCDVFFGWIAIHSGG